MDTERLKRFTELEHRRRELKDEADRVNKEIAVLEEGILKDFEEAGMNSCRVNGLTVFLHAQTWAKARDGDYARACRALEAEGLGDMVQPRFNTNTLSAWVRERQAGGEELPEGLKDSIEVSEVFSVRTRKGA